MKPNVCKGPDGLTDKCSRVALVAPPPESRHPHTKLYRWKIAKTGKETVKKRTTDRASVRPLWATNLWRAWEAKGFAKNRQKCRFFQPRSSAPSYQDNTRSVHMA